MIIRQRNHAQEAAEARKAFIDDNTDLVDEYMEIRHEIGRRVAARTVQYQTAPPQDLLDALSPRSDSPKTKAWDAVAVYARARLEVGPLVDINDPAILKAGPWHTTLHELHPIEQQAPVLRLIR